MDPSLTRPQGTACQIAESGALAPSDLPVVLRYQGRALAAARGRRLFACGMELSVRSLALPIGTCVDLEFFWRDRTWSTSAQVVFRKGSLVGLVFRGSQLELFAELAHLCKEAALAARLPMPDCQRSE